MGLLVSIISTLFITGFAASSMASEQTVWDQAQKKDLAHHIQWLNLIHSKKNLWGTYVSQADGPRFFLAPKGNEDPKAELEATIHAYFLPDTQQKDFEVNSDKKLSTLERQVLSQHAQCRFPARLRFLKRELNWDAKDLPRVSCPLLDNYRNRLDAQSAALVFSSFYLNNPSSTFGHSFLRINSGLWEKYGHERNELLDAGINFAANATVSNPFLYAVFGMAGMFPGRFSVVPYYYKVREYNDYESRDLWSYDLNLTSEELAMLIDHIFEEESTFYNYYYFTENCSYHMFTLLDAAAPRFNLTERLPYIVIPSDTIRVLNQVPGLVKNVAFRASVRSQLKNRLKLMSPAEKSELRKVIKSREPHQILESTLSRPEKAEVLDAFSDQIELAHSKALMTPGSDTQKLKQMVLSERASLGIKSKDLEIPPPMNEAPHLGHGTRRVEVGYGREFDHENTLNLGYRFAMKDLLDPGPGYPANMQVDFGALRGRYRLQSKKFEWDEINLFKLTTLTPIHAFFPSQTFRFDLGAHRWVDQECKNPGGRCFVPEVAGGYGFTVSALENETALFYSFINFKLPYTSKFHGTNVRLSIGPKAGMLFFFTERWKLNLDGELDLRAWSQYHTTKFNLSANMRYAFNSVWAIDFKALKERERTEGVASVFYYY